MQMMQRLNANVSCNRNLANIVYFVATHFTILDYSDGLILLFRGGFSKLSER